MDTCISPVGDRVLLYMWKWFHRFGSFYWAVSGGRWSNGPILLTASDGCCCWAKHCSLHALFEDFGELEEIAWNPMMLLQQHSSLWKLPLPQNKWDTSRVPGCRKCVPNAEFRAEQRREVTLLCWLNVPSPLLHDLSLVPLPVLGV